MLSHMDAAFPIPPSSGRPTVSPGLSGAEGDLLRQSEARFRSLAQVTGQISWIADAQGHLIDHTVWCAYTGQTPEETSGDGWIAAIHPDDRARTLADWTAALGAGEPFCSARRIRRADGQFRTMLGRASPVLDAQGSVAEWVGVELDLAFLQVQCVEQRESQEEFHATFEQAAVGIAHVRLEDGRLLRVNQHLCTVLGYAQEELLLRTFQDLTYPPDLDANVARLERMLAGDISTYTLEKRCIRKDGSLIWVTLNASLKRDQAGTPMYGIAVIEDISTRKAAEEALRRSEEQYRQLFETMAQGVVYQSASGEIRSVNPAAERLLGVTLEELRGRTSLDPRWKMLHEDGTVFPHETHPTMVALRTGHAASAVMGVFHPQEQAYRWLQVTAIPEVQPGASAPYPVFATFEDITEQRRLNQEAAAHARELEAIFASMHEGLLVFGADGRVRRSNPAYAALVGWPAESDLYNLSPEERLQALHVRDSQGVPLAQGRAALEQILRGESVAEEQIVRNLDGRDVAVSIRGAPLIDASGQIEGAVLVVHDITKRRQLERQTLDLANQLEAMFAAIADGVAIYDRSGRLLRANPAYQALLGVPGSSDYSALPVEERDRGFQVHDEGRPPLSESQRTLEELLRGESAGGPGVDFHPKTPDGRDREINVTGGPLRDGAGKVVGAVMVYRDVTERRLLEQQTHQALQALLRMAELLVQHTPEREEQQGPLLVGRPLAELACSLLGCPAAIIITLDPQTRMMRVLGTIGYTTAQEAHLHTLISDWTHTPPDLAHLARLMAGETVVLDVTQPPYQGYAERFEACQSIVAPMQIGGQMIGLVVFNPSTRTQTFTDQQIALAGATAQLVGLVIERERFWREREEARAHALALQESNRQMDTFLGLVSHELRTPLAIMKMSLQLLRRSIEQAHAGKPAEEELRSMVPLPPLLETAERQMRRLERLVKDLLNVVRIKEGKLMLRLDQINLGMLVQEVLAEQRELTPERRIQVEMPPDQAFVVRVDSDQIRQAVTNYLTNALKYSPETAPVVVGVERKVGYVRVWVRDQGAGIPHAEQKQLWERFHRVPGIQEQSGPAGGLGLGLYITRMLIERHQGQVGMDSTPGQGSTFWFTLPLVQAT